MSGRRNPVRLPISGLDSLMSVRSNAVAASPVRASALTGSQTILPALADCLFVAVPAPNALSRLRDRFSQPIPDVVRPSAPHAEFGTRDAQFEAPSRLGWFGRRRPTRPGEIGRAAWRGREENSPIHPPPQN